MVFRKKYDIFAGENNKKTKLMFLCNVVFGGKTEMNFPPMFKMVDEYGKRVPGIPTFIVGWDRTKEVFPDADILSPAVGKDTYWIYGPRERRERYEEGLQWIMDFVRERVTERVQYAFVDVIVMESADEKRQLYKVLVQGGGIEYYVCNEMLYYLYDGKVYGLSLRDIGYMGGDPVRLLREIEENGANRAIDGRDIPDSVYRMIGNRTYLIPYIMSNAV